MKKVSFVIPCYRSALTIGHVVKEIQDTMNAMDEYCTGCAGEARTCGFIKRLPFVWRC